MKINLVFTSQAEKDLEEIQSYYNKILLALTDKFFRELFETLDFIQQEPELYQVRYRKIRIAPLHRFPYGIHYILKKNDVVILRVLHTKRYFK